MDIFTTCQCTREAEAKTKGIAMTGTFTIFFVERPYVEVTISTARENWEMEVFSDEEKWALEQYVSSYGTQATRTDI